MADPVLSIRDLCVDYVTPAGPVRAIDRVSLDEAGLRAVRWRRISMVFQNAMEALNPVLTIGGQLEGVLA